METGALAWIRRNDGTVEVPEQPRVEQWSDGSIDVAWLINGPILNEGDAIHVTVPIPVHGAQ